MSQPSIVKHSDRVLTGTLGGMGWLKTGSFAQLGRRDRNARAHATRCRSLAKLALTEEQIKSIRVPVAVLVGDKDDLITNLYVKPLQRVRKDWSVVEIKDANHLNCIFKPQFREAIAAWLKKNSK